MRRMTTSMRLGRGLRMGASALVMGAGTLATAQVLDPEPAPAGPVLVETEGTSKLVFEETEHKFGQVTDEKKVETSFVFRNDGNGELEIKNVRAGCGCTIPKLRKTTFAPGETGEIKVQFDPAKKRGITNQRITVTSNDPDRPTRILQINAEVLRLVDFDPQSIVLNNVFRGEGAELRIQTRARMADFQFTEMELTGEKIQGVTAELGNFRPVSIEGDVGTLGEIVVKIDPKAEAGVRQGRLVLRTNDPRKPMVTLNMRAEVFGDLAANPRRVSLGGLVGGETYERRVTVDSRSGAAFDIKDVRFDGAQAEGLVKSWKVEPDKRNPSSKMVTVEIMAPARRGIVRGNLVLDTTIADEPTVKVPLSGAVRR